MYRFGKNVLVAIAGSNAYSFGMLSGISDYLHKNRGWAVQLLEMKDRLTPDDIAGWGFDGVLAEINNPEIAETFKALNIPTLNLCSEFAVPEIPSLETANKDIAEMAMEHFHERGFQHYAYFGHSRYAWCKSRGYAFREKVRERGLYFEGYESTASRGAAWNDESFLEWLRSLPKPVGIFCCNDRMGLQVINGCRREGIRTPDEVSVLGVGNHQLICKMSAPALSSIILNTHEAGYQAAASLDQWMKNGTPDSKGFTVAPVEISARASTDALAIEDQDVVTALRFIRANATKGIKVLEVLETVDLSRRVFESRFKKFTGRTPHEEIDRVKLDRVKMLLRETDQTLPEIAKHCGYRHPEYLSAVFARKVGISPSVFRKSCLKSRLFED